jgi:hypothetical protein
MRLVYACFFENETEHWPRGAAVGFIGRAKAVRLAKSPSYITIFSGCPWASDLLK